MPNPLNPLLYRQLKRVFGHVKITNEGEKMIARYQTNPINKREELLVEQTGEYYNVCCPRCNDTRYRLQINHMWGRRDKEGRLNLWLAICHNEHCYNTREKQQDLLYDLTEIDGVLEHARILPGVEYKPDDRVASPPGPVRPLHELPPDHPANRYLAGRFYDPERLGRFYGVGYCEQSIYYLARGRIYVPVYQGGVLKGWQCRHVGEMNWKAEGAPPKWFTDPKMRKSHLLYNIDEAKKWRTGVIVEGAGDVWGFGPMSTATFGASMSIHQRREVKARFGRNGSAVLLWDPDLLTPVKPDDDEKTRREKERKIKSYERLVETMKNGFRHGFAPIQLPAGTDPGSLDRGFMRDFVIREARGLGVKVWWKQK